MPEPTIRDLARLAGVCPATVSLSLRDSPKISVSTTNRIKDIAKEIGYRINPLIATLMAHQRSTKAKPPYVATIALITPHRVSDHTDLQWYAPVQVVRHARSRASELGYQLEEIPHRDLGIASERLNQIMINRGIVGAIFLHMVDLGDMNGLDWGRFSLIAVGNSTFSPRLNHVQSDHYQIVSQAMERIVELGYRRPGLAIWPFLNAVTGHRYAAAYLNGQQQLRPQDRLPALICEPDDEPAFQKWLLKNKPDVVLTGNGQVENWLKNAGCKIPDDIGVVHFDVSPEMSDCSGMDQNRQSIGAEVVNSIVAQHQRNERGIPQTPKSMLIEGTWIPGKTVRVQENGGSPSYCLPSYLH